MARAIPSASVSSAYPFSTKRCGCLRTLWRRAAHLLLTLAAGLSAARACATGELQLFGGGVSAGGDLSRNYQLDYHEAIGSPSASRSVSRLAGGLTYYNEGHFSGHHRDGYAAQLWLRSDDAARTRFAFGVGPYWYFDTALAGSAASHRNIHGVGLLWSAMASYDLNRRWFAAARINRTQTRSSFDTTAYLLGLGLRIDEWETDPARTDSSRWRTVDFRNEIAVAAGTTVANSFAGERSHALHIQYRRRLYGVIEGSIAYLDEGSAVGATRSGVAAQLWLMRRFSGDRYELGVGYGPYVGLERGETGRSRINARLSLSAGYRFADRWTARLQAGRIVTVHDRDTDVFLLGLAYLF